LNKFVIPFLGALLEGPLMIHIIIPFPNYSYNNPDLRNYCNHLILIESRVSTVRTRFKIKTGTDYGMRASVHKHDRNDEANILLKEEENTSIVFKLHYSSVDNNQQVDCVVRNITPHIAMDRGCTNMW
jgi:hypothetical protein